MSSTLFRRKTLGLLADEAAARGAGTLRRVLGPLGLVAFGVGVIVGAGLFSITGTVAAAYTGPAITISFAIAALGCALTGLCYAEFASMIPISGSAYTYSYATMGELIAWIIGWDLVLEYTVAAITVSISWSQYLVQFLADCGMVLPADFTACPWDGGALNLPAAAVVVVMTLFLVRGTRESALLNNIIVALKVGVILLFIVLGWHYIDADNYRPYLPPNTGELGVFGWSGVLRGAAIVFFAFLGFDAVSTAAQESRNPRRDMPIGILLSLLVCTVLYVLFGHVMTGVAHYTEFAGKEGLAPVAVAIGHMGSAAGTETVAGSAYPWLGKAVMIAILLGYCSVILVLLMAQSRIFMAMSRDGLLPPVFSRLSRRRRTPVGNNLIFMVVVAVLAAVMPARVAGEMCSIGTLLAFMLVSGGVIVMRRTMPAAPRAFRVPFVPLVPLLGIAVCLVLMIFLPADTWIRLVVWMLIGLDIYAGYGIGRSHLAAGNREAPVSARLALYALCLLLAVLCIVTGFWHQASAGWQSDRTMLCVALVFGLGHTVYYAWRLAACRC